MILRNYNPDVLLCLANLSNDEVFTPPNLANDILDLLPTEIWSDKNTKFLDPVSKTGVFLREIARRLNEGLKEQIPDQQDRLNHIFTSQVFGIAITELTGFMSRRSLYCSKTANGKYSVCTNFKDDQGNIVFDKIEHNWIRGNCSYCGASEEVYNRGEELETHAYQFIHTKDPSNIFGNMKFDVIIGNPPYQLDDAGFGRSASPLYQLFVQQAKKLNPRFLTMIIPSRWFAGGKGLDEFRTEMLNDKRIRAIVDFWDSTDVFPGVDIAGGVCYFLWEKDYSGPAEVTNIHRNKRTSSIRKLNQFPTLIRFGKAAEIIEKIKTLNEKNMSEQVSSRKPFGLTTNIRPKTKGDIKLYWNGGIGPYDSKEIEVGKSLINKWKVITSKVSYDHGGQPDAEGKRRVLSKVEILEPGTICTETYIVVGSFDDEADAKNLKDYLKTKFVRFLISQLSFSQDITKERFLYVPVQDFRSVWDDEKLYKKYNLSKEEIDFIESMVRSM